MIFALTSCTYDYFVDENNFRLYVPQIEDGSIQHFYVAFHAEDGSHVITREVTAPFDKDELMMQGILRFKLPPGKTYHITCFADYAPGSLTMGEIFAESRKRKELDVTKANIYVDDNNVYALRSTNPRSIFAEAMAYPIGHPDSQEPVEINIDETRRFKGSVVLSFIDLPPVISRIDTYFHGLATRYYFDGTFRRNTQNDRIRGSHYTADYLEGNTVNIKTLITPSAGTEFHKTRACDHLSHQAPLELEMRFYDASGNSAGAMTFTEDDFNNLPDDKKPVDENGVPVTSLALHSQETIKFTFKDFTVIGIELLGWGDIKEGETTPM